MDHIHWCQTKLELDGIGLIRHRSLKLLVVLQQVAQQPPLSSPAQHCNNIKYKMI